MHRARCTEASIQAAIPKPGKPLPRSTAVRLAQSSKRATVFQLTWPPCNEAAEETERNDRRSKKGLEILRK